MPEQPRISLSLPEDATDDVAGLEDDLDVSLLKNSLAKTRWERIQANDDALRFAETLRAAMENRNEFVLVGGFAAVAHGVTLVTRDVDICCRFDEANLRRVEKALVGLNPTWRRSSAPKRR